MELHDPFPIQILKEKVVWFMKLLYVRFLYVAMWLAV